MSAKDRGYWRSLEALADEPHVRELLEREFPEGASELPEGVSRRTMLSLIGASLSLAGLTACRRPVERIVPYVKAPEDLIPGIPQRFATTFASGHEAVGLVVESHEYRPTKIEGNELHPASRGASSARIQASILDLYDPDRSPAVLHGVERKSFDDFVKEWATLAAPYAESGGQGLAVLLEPCSSPSLSRLSAAFRARYPKARFVVWSPVSDENIHAGAGLAAGEPLQPVYHFDRASVILALDSDFLQVETDSLRHARDFADGRRVAAPGDAMSRLYVVESALSVTGANAEHRLRLPSGQVGAFLARLAARLGQGGEVGPPLAEAGAEAWIALLARELEGARGRGLVVAGRRQPPEVHAAAFALNAALGNVGQTVSFERVAEAERSESQDLAALARALVAGEVETLVVLGANPAYTAPADLDFEVALGRAGRVVHLGTHRDETAQLATWHLPQAHFLESWGDARGIGGPLSVIQPLIAPLFDGHSVLELLALLATGEQHSGHDVVRETWGTILGSVDFEKRFRRVLHDGLLPGSEAPALSPTWSPSVFSALTARAATAKPPEAASLELSFHPSPAVHDGRQANNAWLQELPDPVTKITWDNAALISPQTAEALGLENEDMARLSYGGRELELVVWTVPGQADRTVALHLGYGRKAAGRIGDGRGFDAFTLRTSSAPDFGSGATLAAVGRRYVLAQTQDHGSMEGRPLVREATLEHFAEHPEFAREAVEVPPLRSLWPDRTYSEGPQWGMSIDLNACIGCNACVIACQSENNVPVVGKDQVHRAREMHWIRVDRYFTGEPADPQMVFQPVPCMHCENAPCEQVCPVAATVHDEHGLNSMVYNRCIGTRYCANNCPYKVRRFNFYNFTKDLPEIQKMSQNPDVTVRSRGVMEKCTYCTQRINAARIDAKLAGRTLRDGDVTTACEQACPTRAITFGDIRDPGSRVARAKAEPRNYIMLEELNNRPRTSYLAKLRDPHPGLAPAGGAEEHHG